MRNEWECVMIVSHEVPLPFWLEEKKRKRKNHCIKAKRKKSMTGMMNAP